MINIIRTHRVLSLSLLLLTLVLAALLMSIGRNSVDYVSPKYGPIVEAIYGLGKVKTDRVYEVKLSVVKAIEQLYVKEGDKVKKNDNLVKMEGDLYFRAPFDGTVTAIGYHQAQSVFPQQAVLRLENLENKYIEVSLEQQGALRVQTGQKVRVLFESIRGEQLTGEVASVFPRDEEFLAHIRLQGLGGNVLPGMTADVAIETGRRDKALLVPLSGVSDGRVRILRDGKKVVRELKIGSIDGNWAEVLEGDVKESDQVIIKRKK